MYELYETDRQLAKYRVWIDSRPGFYAQYSGKLDVYAVDEEDAENKAYRDLQRGAFPDRNRSMWRTVKIECLGFNA